MELFFPCQVVLRLKADEKSRKQQLLLRPHSLHVNQKCEPIIYKLCHLGFCLNEFISQTLGSCYPVAFLPELAGARNTSIQWMTKGQTEQNQWYLSCLQQSLIFGVCQVHIFTFAGESAPHKQLPEKTPPKSLLQRATPELTTQAVKIRAKTLSLNYVTLPH